MKPFRLLCAALLLAFALSTNAFAGDIPSPPGQTDVPPSAAGQVDTPPADGTIHTGLYYWLDLFF